MTEKDPLAAKIDALRGEFIGRLPERLDRIMSARQVVLDGATGEAWIAAMDILHRDSHGLAGTGPMFGLHDLGVAARAAEKIAHQCLEANAVSGPELMDALDQMISAIETAQT